MSGEEQKLWTQSYTLEEMTAIQHKRLRYGEWLQADPREKYLLEIATEYFDQCDAYDHRVCTGTRNGEAFPVTPDEQKAINANAYQTRRYLIARYNLSEREFQEAVQSYHRTTK